MTTQTWSQVGWSSARVLLVWWWSAGILLDIVGELTMSGVQASRDLVGLLLVAMPCLHVEINMVCGRFICTHIADQRHSLT